MPTDLPTLGAPVMILGLLAGFFLCFYGNVAKKYLVPLRSVLSGSMVSIALVFLFMQKEALILHKKIDEDFNILKIVGSITDLYRELVKS